MTVSHPGTSIGPRDILVHVGPHKTGTSAIQGSLHRARASLLEQGVTVPGTKQDQDHAARAVTKFASTTGMADTEEHRWTDLVELVGRSPGRTVISSEYFDVAIGEVVQRIADDLGPERLHIVVTSTPLTSLLPSNWQQRVRGRAKASFDEWLTNSFADHDAGKETIFWRRQRIDSQVTRWAEVLGTDHVHLVITDKHVPRQIFDSFEQLLAVAPNTLVASSKNNNRSLSWPEAEFMRRMNEIADGLGWSGPTHARFIRMGAGGGIMGSRTPAPDEPRITLPAWARERALEVSRLMVENIQASGVEVMGDLSVLVPESPTDAVEPEPVTMIDLEMAARAAIGAMKAGGAGILNEKHVERPNLSEYPGISSAPTELLIAELERRSPKKRRRFGRG